MEIYGNTQLEMRQIQGFLINFIFYYFFEIFNFFFKMQENTDNQFD